MKGVDRVAKPLILSRSPYIDVASLARTHVHTHNESGAPVYERSIVCECKLHEYVITMSVWVAGINLPSVVALQSTLQPAFTYFPLQPGNIANNKLK